MAVRGAPQPAETRRSSAFRQLIQQHGDVVVVAERPLGAVKRGDVPTDRRTAASTRRSAYHSALICLRQAWNAAASRSSCARRIALRPRRRVARIPTATRAELAMLRPPPFDVFSKTSKVPIDVLQRASVANAAQRCLLVRGQPPAQARERLLADEMRILAAFSLSRISIIASASRSCREGAVDLAQALAVAAQAAAGIRSNQIADGAHLLDALARAVNRPVAGRLRQAKLFARRSQFFFASRRSPCATDSLDRSRNATVPGLAGFAPAARPLARMS